jgi:hypothetical protein
MLLRARSFERRPGHLAVVPEHSLKGRGARIHLILHGHTARLQRGVELVPVARKLESGGALQSWRATRNAATGSDGGGEPCGSDF